MGYPIAYNLAPVAAVAQGYCQTQTGLANVPLLLNGSLVQTVFTNNPYQVSVANGIMMTGPTSYLAGVPDIARPVVIYSTGNDNGINFTVTGLTRKERGYALVSTVIAGGSGSAVTTSWSFSQVISIVPSGNTASTVYAGTGATIRTPWVLFSNFIPMFSVSAAVIVNSGSPSAQVEYTYDDPTSAVPGQTLLTGVVYPRVFTLSGMTALNATKDGSLSSPVRAARVTVTALPCNVSTLFLQQGM